MATHDTKHTQVQASAIQAHHAALRRLQALHPEDWDRMLSEERVIRGLPSNSKEDQKARKIRYFEDQVKKYQNRLDELNKNEN